MRGRSRGFSMMEVLVAMLVIGTGALAIAMLQLHALRSSRDSSLHARATLMAQELAELRAALPAGTAPSDALLFSLTTGKPLSAPADCEQAACSPTDFALASLADWSGRLVRDFPHVRVTVCRDGQRAAPEDWRCDALEHSPVVLKMAWRRLATGSPAAGGTTPLLSLTLGH
ncbi:MULTISPECIES: type IV pilus modification protein PilV [unclassified Herbaspirillum]|jgi:type IV pilus assembly protein PilV|uniref:type IV pilus modification protein PilV n=1 Tax=unclassified Herbaspirillum TaxID=2624150 RepID=UPI001584FAC9|nr:MULTISPECIES: type IV pilus modification protein PilV [unclassified Herbaspirillum]MCI1003388.1 type IV pilus modification protein PilV [Herbaspirillum sp. C7C8]NUT62238.1 type IV pilus modification protein PilV [Herbaspirillum sp. C9C3]